MFLIINGKETDKEKSPPDPLRGEGEGTSSHCKTTKIHGRPGIGLSRNKKEFCT